MECERGVWVSVRGRLMMVMITALVMHDISAQRPSYTRQRFLSRQARLEIAAPQLTCVMWSLQARPDSFKLNVMANGASGGHQYPFNIVC